jgi:DNA-directed RNA polymerase subunit omega
MARITVEDCLSKIESQYDLVLLAKERTAQLNSGEKPLVAEDNDKNTVIALREIGGGKISIKTIEDAAINKLRKEQSEPTELEDFDIDKEDDFDKIYKGEISKSGAAILPSKRVRKIPEKILTESTAENETETNLDESNKLSTPENKTE